MAKDKRTTRLVRMNTGVFDTERGLFEPDKVYELPAAMATRLVEDRAAEWADARLVPENAVAAADETETKECVT